MNEAAKFKHKFKPNGDNDLMKEKIISGSFFGVLSFAFSVNSSANCPDPSKIIKQDDEMHIAYSDQGIWLQEGKTVLASFRDIQSPKLFDINSYNFHGFSTQPKSDEILVMGENSRIDKITCKYILEDTKNNNKIVNLSSPKGVLFVPLNKDAWWTGNNYSKLTNHEFQKMNHEIMNCDQFNLEKCGFEEIITRHTREYTTHCNSSICGNTQKPLFFKIINFPMTYKSYTYRKNNPVTIIDSEIHSIPSINITATYRHIPKESQKKDLDSPNYIHGTAMASIIAGTHYLSGDQSFIGILPGTPIINRIVMPSNGSKTAFLDAVTSAVLSENEKILNISGADIGSKNATEWTELLKKIGQENKVLIVAAVGNDARNIATTPIDYQYWPAAYKPKRKIDKENDPVIRVAALQFDNTGFPKLYATRNSGSRYGKDRVDIGAPGFNIPYLTPSNEMGVGNGTSEATAIVSGVIAAMSACTPSTSPNRIKEILFKTADKYDHLNEFITEGRVLNAGKALEEICTPMIPVEEIEKKTTSWNITLKNHGYIDYFLSDLEGLEQFKPKFSVTHKNDNIPFFLTVSGQIYTTVAHSGAAVCLTASEVSEASWQHVGFIPCSKSYNKYQTWDLSFISSDVTTSDNFVKMDLKLKESNTCLRMKNNNSNWGELFLSRCEEYTDNSWLLKLNFTPNKIGFAFKENVN